MAWYQKAKAGDKVVCIDDDWDCVICLPSPSRGKVYAIKLVEVLNCYFDGCPVYIRLEGCDDSYAVGCFKPVEPKDTKKEVEKLKRLLNMAPADRGKADG